MSDEYTPTTNEVRADKRAQAEPTDAQVKAGFRALYEYAGLEMYPDVLRAALRAAFTARQEEQS